MKCVFSAMLLFLLCTFTKAQDQDPLTEYMNPSAVHSLLSKYTGLFKMQISISMGEGEKPLVVIVNSENRMLLGNRFLEMKQLGNMLGTDYQSISTLGFNNSDKNFTLTTISNLLTGTLSLVGPWDEKMKVATVRGKMMDPMTKKILPVKQVITFVDADTLLIENFDKHADKPEQLTIWYKLTRIR
ncbi:DUF1579 family protein [Chryseobacterium sp. A301]